MATRTRKKMTSNNGNGKMDTNQQLEMIQFLRRMNVNQIFSRAALTQYLAGGGHPIDDACGYPLEIPVSEYKNMIEREGIAERANRIFPAECWSVMPWVYETESVEGNAQTPFEKAWATLAKNGLYAKLAKLDEISGIGHFGAMLIGTRNSGPLHTPFPGFDEDGNVAKPNVGTELTYLTPFDETEVQIKEWNKNSASTRFGKPLLYNVTIANPTSPNLSAGISQPVHWTRIIHVAENSTNGVFGKPRLKKVWNYILNIRKILGGSAEMFWNGGFPGTAFTVPPELAAGGITDEEKKALSKEIEEYYGGFKRYLALSGVEAKQLEPNIADPMPHLTVQMQALSISCEVPMRVFLGSEEARLASMNDSEAWNRRVHRRHDLHVTPNILMQTGERFWQMGIVPKPAELKVKWPDVYSVSEADRADIIGKLVRALKDYLTGGVWKIFPPLQFFSMLMDLTTEEAEEVLSAAEKAIKDKSFDYLNDLIQKPKENTGSGANGTKKKQPLGTTTKVKTTTSPATNELVINPLMRCQRDGSPGFKYGNGGHCYTYTKGDDDSKKQARHKARIQGIAIEVSKHLNNVNVNEPITTKESQQTKT